MAKAVSGKTPLRRFKLWGTAFLRGTGYSPFGVCPLDQCGAYPSLVHTNLSVHLLFSLFPMGISASSFVAPYRNPSLSGILWFQDLFYCCWHWRELRNLSLMMILLINLIHFKVSIFRQGVCVPDCWRWLNSDKIQTPFWSCWMLQSEVSGKFHRVNSLEQDPWKLSLTVPQEAENV